MEAKAASLLQLHVLVLRNYTRATQTTGNQTAAVGVASVFLPSSPPPPSLHQPTQLQISLRRTDELQWRACFLSCGIGCPHRVLMQ